MILKKVQLTNFMCYYEENDFEFSEGINVVIGDNGYGKSKLFDAIYWVMYDQCFDTSADEFKTTKQLNNKLISDRAIHEAEDGKIQCSVSLTFYDSRNENTYTIERGLTGTKNDGEVTYASTSYEKVTERKGVLSAQIVDDQEKIDRLKRRILPDNIKPYMWFQGEQIDNIIDFKESETLTRAINVLSDISKFDEIFSITDSLVTSVENELKKKQRSLSKDKDKSDELEEEIKQKKSLLGDYQNDLKQANKGKNIAEERTEELLAKIDVAQEIRELDNDRNRLENEFNKTVFELDALRESFNKRLFTRGWVLKGVSKLFKEYEAKYKNYNEAKLDLKRKLQAENKIQERLQTRLPINVPEPIYVQKMIEQEKCLVCDREAKEGTDAYKAIKSLIGDSSEKRKRLESEIKHRFDFSNSFESLYRNGLSQEGRISDIDDDINDTLQRIDDLTQRKDELKRELDEVKNQVKNFIADSSINVDDAKHIASELQASQSMTSRFSTDIGSYKGRIKALEDEVKSLEIKYEKLVVGDLPAHLMKKVDISRHLNKAAKSTRSRVFRELIRRLETEANKHYQNMTQDNMSARGIIKLREYDGNYTPELIDSDGKQLSQINMGNILLIKLATIMAIISARQSTRDTQLYTLISDAPMSVFGEDYTIGFCKTVSQVYRQSIIMSKDFYKNDKLREQLLNSEEINLGKIYMIKPNLPEEERESRHKLATEINSLN
ncbi:MAG: AAA family ATPase [Balneola sp.]